MSEGAVSPSDLGLQAERTGLAWSRTSLGVAANAGLLAVRQIGPPPSVAGLAPSVLALVLAVAVAVYGRRRTRRLRVAPLPSPLAPSRAVPLFGGSVVVLAVLSGVALLA